MSLKFLYNWKSGKFVHDGGVWSKTYDSGANLVKNSTFSSITKGSLIKSFSLLGYRDGDIAVSLKYQVDTPDAEDSAFCDFLREAGCVPTWMDHHIGIFKTKTLKQTRTIMELLTLNNELPVEDENLKGFLKDLETGSCENDKKLGVHTFSLSPLPFIPGFLGSHKPNVS